MVRGNVSTDLLTNYVLSFSMVRSENNCNETYWKGFSYCVEISVQEGGVGEPSRSVTNN